MNDSPMKTTSLALTAPFTQAAGSIAPPSSAPVCIAASSVCIAESPEPPVPEGLAADPPVPTDPPPLPPPPPAGGFATVAAPPDRHSRPALPLAACADGDRSAGSAGCAGLHRRRGTLGATRDRCRGSEQQGDRCRSQFVLPPNPSTASMNTAHTGYWPASVLFFPAPRDHSALKKSQIARAAKLGSSTTGSYSQKRTGTPGSQPT